MAALERSNMGPHKVGKEDAVIANNCEQFRCDFKEEWCSKYGKLDCKDCPDFVKTDNEELAWERN